MRKLLIVPALFISQLCLAYVGSEIGLDITKGPDVGGHFPHFSTGGVSGAGSNGTSWQEMRLIGKTYLVYNNNGFVPQDSSIYKYSERRGGVPDLEKPNVDEHLLFDESIEYSYVHSTASYVNSKRRIQKFINKQIEELVFQNWHTNSSDWKNAERYLYKYDMSGKMTSSNLQLWYGTLWTNNMNSTIGYDSKSNVVQLTNTTYQVDFIYDNNNNLVSMSDKVWQQGNGWVNNERKTYIYSGKDVIDYTQQEWTNGGWENKVRWTYTYNSSSELQTEHKYLWNSNNNWEKTTKYDYTYNTSGDIVELITSEWHAASAKYVNAKKEIRQYNSRRKIELLKTYTWQNNSWANSTSDYEIRYYYEFYDATIVDDVVASSELQLYPIPANDVLHVAIDWQEAKDVVMALYNMSGQLVYTQSKDAVKTYNDVLPVGQLPSGSYVFTISTESGQLSRNLVVNH